MKSGTEFELSWLCLLSYSLASKGSNFNVLWSVNFASSSLLVFFFKRLIEGSLGGAAVWHLPLAQGAILETPDRIPHRAPGAWSLLLPLPMSLPLSLSLCDYHK